MHNFAPAKSCSTKLKYLKLQKLARDSMKSKVMVGPKVNNIPTNKLFECVLMQFFNICMFELRMAYG